jgi:sulfur carrier protein
VKVLLRNPRREVELVGPRSVDRLLEELGLSREAQPASRSGTRGPGAARLRDDDGIEVRPVISGGAG